MKNTLRAAVGVASVLLFLSSGMAGQAQTVKSGASRAQETTTSQKAKPKTKMTRKQRAADEAKAKALAEARRPRICKTRENECSYGAGPVGEQCSCWSKSGAPDLGITVRR
ncbi:MULTISPECIES: hypothetical protein [unclassified Ensifer]|uniref:hypothetical protein n=1 Tax=unclassified Ensifer TaxID=2633371 RepID=UPI00177CBE17|nr:MULTISPECIES: hypothetical protein [unclassified Ensifer]MBD9556364.1 hypothetical protein [Ensifer sp. ENS03]MCY1744201.1 hypothetical protein [Ensifer sp. SL37]